jgi:carboxyl-terminal processing protease
MSLPPVRALALSLIVLGAPMPLALAQDKPATAPPTVIVPLAPAFPATSSQPAVPGSSNPSTPRTQAEVYADLVLFGRVLDRVRAEYVDVPDEKKLIHAALQGMLSSLDPHSGYLEPQSYKDMQQDTSGQFGGIGIELQVESGNIKVVSPIDGTPAAKAGILPNDLIVQLDGVQVQSLALEDAVKKMRGPVGSKVKVTVQREGVKAPIDFLLTRDIIAVQAVHWTLEGDVGVLRLAKFSEQAYPGIRKAINDIYTQRLGIAPKGLILDLRDNPGGLVDQAILVANAFVQQGAIVSTRSRLVQESARYLAKPNALEAKIANVPLIVLINGGSASAAEILVKETIPDAFKGKDEIVGEAALPGQIGGGTQPVATSGSSVYVPTDKTKDDQLQYALKLINGTLTDPSYPPKAGAAPS